MPAVQAKSTGKHRIESSGSDSSRAAFVLCCFHSLCRSVCSALLWRARALQLSRLALCFYLCRRHNSCAYPLHILLNINFILFC